MGLWQALLEGKGNPQKYTHTVKMHSLHPTAHSTCGWKNIQMGSSNTAEIHDLIRESVQLQSIFQMRHSKRNTIGQERA